MVTWQTILTIAIILVTADKVLTMINVELVKDKYPNIDPLTIEKNPVTKFFFERFGLFGGTIIFWFISIFTFMVATYCMSAAVGTLYSYNNRYGVSLYLMMMFYGFVIFNNIYFMLRYKGVI